MKDIARHTALQALLQMEQNEGYSNIVIDKALRANGLNRRDASFAAVIFYGVLERRLTLDHFLRGCLKDPDLDVAAMRRLSDPLSGQGTGFRCGERGSRRGENHQGRNLCRDGQWRPAQFVSKKAAAVIAGRHQRGGTEFAVFRPSGVDLPVEKVLWQVSDHGDS